jgi:hypothetical protein
MTIVRFLLPADMGNLAQKVNLISIARYGLKLCHEWCRNSNCLHLAARSLPVLSLSCNGKQQQTENQQSSNHAINIPFVVTPNQDISSFQ